METKLKIVNLPGLGEKQDVSDWLNAGNTKEALIKLASEAHVLSVKTLDKHFLTTLGKPLILYPQAAVTYKIEPLIVSDHINTLYGPGGNAKSMLALAMCASIASNAKFVDQATLPGKALYVDFELSGGVQSQRLSLLCKGLGIEPESLAYSLDYCAPGVDENIPTKLKEIIALLIEQKKINNYSLIVIDSIGAALEGDPESAGDICALLQSLRPLGTVLLLDHQAKNQRGDKSSAKTPFGSVYKTNLSRNVWHLNSEPAGDKRMCQLTHKKSNFGAIQEPLSFEITFAPDSISIAACEAGEELIEHLTVKQKIIMTLRQLQKATNKMVADEIEESLETIKSTMSLLVKNGDVIATDEKDGQAVFYKLPDVEPDAEPSVKTGVNQLTCNKDANTPIEQGKHRVVKNSKHSDLTLNTCEPGEAILDPFEIG